MDIAEYIEYLNKDLLNRDTAGFLLHLKDYIEKFHSIKQVAIKSKVTQDKLLKILTREVYVKTEQMNVILESIGFELYYSTLRDYEEN